MKNQKKSQLSMVLDYLKKHGSLDQKQAIKYYNIAKKTEEFKKYNNCFLIVGYGTKPLKCEIYSTTDRKIILTKKKLEEMIYGEA